MDLFSCLTEIHDFNSACAERVRGKVQTVEKKTGAAANTSIPVIIDVSLMSPDK